MGIKSRKIWTKFYIILTFGLIILSFENLGPSIILRSIKQKSKMRCVYALKRKNDCGYRKISNIQFISIYLLRAMLDYVKYVYICLLQNGNDCFK